MCDLPMITSKNNDRIKLIKRLQIKKHRDKDSLFYLEGVRIIEEALSTTLVQSLFFTERLRSAQRGIELLDKANKQEIPMFECSEQVLAELTDTVNSQGVVAVLAKPTWPLIPHRFLLIADELQDPGNMGTLMRTAVAAGVSGLLVVDGSVDLYNPKVLRSSMGAIFHLPHWSLQREQILDFLDRNGSSLIIADLVDAQDYCSINYPQNLAVVIGNEARGVHKDFREQAAIRVRIPLIGPVESLNASVAAGVLLYEILRQHRCHEESLMV